MKRYVSLVLLGLVVFGIMLSGCSSSSSSSSPSKLFDVTGIWVVEKVGMGNLVFHLNQDAQGNISGTVDRSVVGASDNGTITGGSNTNNNITIDIRFDDGMTATFTGTVTDVNNMNGRYTDSQNSSDAWSATRSQ